MDLQQFEPSACRCDSCRQTCRSNPGFLAPGDLDRIVEHVGAEQIERFEVDHFEAVACAGMIDFGSGATAVPAIVPRQRDGRCVFLTRDERCGVHAVRPFGCAVANACEGGNAAANEACLRAVADDEEYLEQWTEIACDGVRGVL